MRNGIWSHLVTMPRMRLTGKAPIELSWFMVLIITENMGESLFHVSSALLYAALQSNFIF